MFHSYTCCKCLQLSYNLRKGHSKKRQKSRTYSAIKSNKYHHERNMHQSCRFTYIATDAHTYVRIQQHKYPAFHHVWLCKFVTAAIIHQTNNNNRRLYTASFIDRKRGDYLKVYNAKITRRRFIFNNVLKRVFKLYSYRIYKFNETQHIQYNDSLPL